VPYFRVIAVALLLTAATARAGIYQPGTQPRTTPAASLLAGDNVLPPTLQLERSSYCLDCHAVGTPSTTSTSPGATWGGSMMANAARDPLFYAALAVANQDVAGIGGDYCLRCHSPGGFTAGHTVMNPPGSTGFPCHSYDPGSPNVCRCLNPPACTQRDTCNETPARVANGYCMVAFDDRVDPNFKGHPADPRKHQLEPYAETPTVDGDIFDDTEGLNCATCHRVDPAVPFVRKSGGNYHLSTATGVKQATWATPRSLRYGPYNDFLTNCTDPNDPTTCGSGTPHAHNAQGSVLHTQAEFCAQCHDVTNPTLDRLTPQGVSMGFKMPIERTFSEWKASDYRDGGARAERCQSCHMPGPDGNPPGGVCSATDAPTRNPYNRNRVAGDEVHQHEFTGGNAWMPTVFANVMAPSGAAGDPAWFFNLVDGAQRQGAFSYTASRAQATLQRAASLTVTAPPASARSGETVTFGVHVENNTGHKLPTGYPEGRRMWIQVFASVPGQAGADPFFASGAYDDATGVLTRDAQIKVYEVELSTAGKSAPPNPPEFHFVTNQIVWKDNRIPPAGFDTAAAGFAELAPVGYSYPLVAGTTTMQSWDDTPYTVKVPEAATGDVTFTVKLVYQTASKDYVDFLRDANTSNDRGKDMTRIWQNHGRAKFVEMASTSFTVKNPAPCVPSAERCDGVDNDCNGTIDDGELCADMSVPNDDAAAGGSLDMTPAAPKPSGCGLSVAGSDFRDLGPFAILLAAGALLALRRRARW
jgi:hypothetical protein